MFAGWYDRNGETDALRRQHLPPLRDELPIRFTHRAYLAIQIVQPHRVDVIILFAQSRVPVHLVSEGIPGEANDWISSVTDTQQICPFLPEPVNCLIPTRAFSDV